jgi:hypothetical protein
MIVKLLLVVIVGMLATTPASITRDLRRRGRDRARTRHGSLTRDRLPLFSQHCMTTLPTNLIEIPDGLAKTAGLAVGNCRRSGNLATRVAVASTRATHCPRDHGKTALGVDLGGQPRWA